MNCVRRTALAIACLLLLSTAQAKWKKIGVNDQGNFYVDEASLVAKGNVRSLLTLDDMKRTSMQGDRSIIARQEVDCNSQKFRSVNTTYFSDPMGKGKYTVLEPEVKPDSAATPKGAIWLTPTVGQPSEQIVKWACRDK